MGLYKKLNVCISDNLGFVAIHCSIHVFSVAPGRGEFSATVFLTDRGRSSG